MTAALMPPTLQLLLPMLAAVCTAVAVDLAVAGKGLPPGFAVSWRRAMASGLVAGILFVGTFASLAVVAPGDAVDLAGIPWWQIFTLHALIAVTLFAWGVLAWAGFESADDGEQAEAAQEAATPPPVADDPLPWRLDAESEAAVPPPTLARRLATDFRFAVAPGKSVLTEIGLGLAVGPVIWFLVIAASATAAVLLGALDSDLLPSGEMPPMVAFLAAQPFLVRLGASLSAGFFEETFFRGFLQPRLGIAFSTVLFVLAHWSYGSPFMLIGVTLLSLAYAALARWRGNVWAAAAAHAAFDAIQLLVVLPNAARLVGGGG